MISCHPSFHFFPHELHFLFLGVCDSLVAEEWFTGHSDVFGLGRDFCPGECNLILRVLEEMKLCLRVGMFCLYLVCPFSEHGPSSRPCRSFRGNLCSHCAQIPWKECAHWSRMRSRNLLRCFSPSFVPRRSTRSLSTRPWKSFQRACLGARVCIAVCVWTFFFQFTVISLGVSYPFFLQDVA